MSLTYNGVAAKQRLREEIDLDALAQVTLTTSLSIATATHGGKHLIYAGSSALTITLSDIDDGTYFWLSNKGSGTITLSGAATLRGYNTITQNEHVFIQHVDTNIWEANNSARLKTKADTNETEIQNARDGEASLLAKNQAQDARLAALEAKPTSVDNIFWDLELLNKTTLKLFDDRLRIAKVGTIDYTIEETPSGREINITSAAQTGLNRLIFIAYLDELELEDNDAITLLMDVISTGGGTWGVSVGAANSSSQHITSTFISEVITTAGVRINHTLDTTGADRIAIYLTANPGNNELRIKLPRIIKGTINTFNKYPYNLTDLELKLKQYEMYLQLFPAVRNIHRFSEEPDNAHFSKGPGASVSSESIVKKGITLKKLSMTGFYSSLYVNLSGQGYTFTSGRYYLISYYSVNADSSELFTYPRYIANGGSFGQGAKLHDGNLRRSWFVAYANSTNSLRVVDDPTAAMSSAGLTPYLLSASSLGQGNIYVGGFQIELIDSSLNSKASKMGIALIGDSTMEGSSGSTDSVTSKEVSRYVEGLLNCDVINEATGGERTDAMDARWATDMTPLAVNCRYCIIQGGLNDLAQSRAVADIQASFTSMYNKAVTDGMKPVFLTLTPTTGIVTAGKEADRITLNNWLKSTYDTIDIATPLQADDDASVLHPAWVGDGVHYTLEGKRKAAQLIADWGGWDFVKPTPYQRVVGTTPDTPTLLSEVRAERSLMHDVIPLLSLKG